MLLQLFRERALINLCYHFNIQIWFVYKLLLVRSWLKLNIGMLAFYLRSRGKSHIQDVVVSPILVLWLGKGKSLSENATVKSGLGCPAYVMCKIGDHPIDQCQAYGERCNIRPGRKPGGRGPLHFTSTGHAPRHEVADLPDRRRTQFFSGIGKEHHADHMLILLLSQTTGNLTSVGPTFVASTFENTFFYWQAIAIWYMRYLIFLIAEQQFFDISLNRRRWWKCLKSNVLLTVKIL